MIDADYDYGDYYYEKTEEEEFVTEMYYQTSTKLYYETEETNIKEVSKSYLVSSSSSFKDE